MNDLNEIRDMLFNISSQLEAAERQLDMRPVFAFEAGNLIGSLRRLVRGLWQRGEHKALSQNIENLVYLAKGELYYMVLPNNSEEGSQMRLEGAINYIEQAREMVEEVGA